MIVLETVPPPKWNIKTNLSCKILSLYLIINSSYCLYFTVHENAPKTWSVTEDGQNFL